MKLLLWFGRLLVTLAILPLFAWAYGALYYDGPSKWFAALMAAAVFLAFVVVNPFKRKVLVFAVWFTVILGWWLTLKPTNTSDWQANVSQHAWADINGDVVTLHNVRNCDYRTETDYTPRWETRTVRISQITGVDIAIDYWGSPWMAHPIISFQFADAPPVCFSIETRMKNGQSYSAIGGLYRQFELIYIVADERDVIRLRTNYRHEDIYLYRLTLSPEAAQERFREYLHALNQNRDHPRWYNAITTNCTTSIRQQELSTETTPWNWRILLNGKGDELMYQRHLMVTAGLPFAELKKRALIDSAAKAANDSPDFTRLIREGRPGF